MPARLLKSFPSSTCCCPDSSQHGQVVTVWRGYCSCFPVSAGILPQEMRIAVQVHMQKRPFLAIAGNNKQALAVCGPIQRHQVVPAFHLNPLRCLAAQGENVYGPCRTWSSGNAPAIRRKVKPPLILNRAEIKASELWTASMQRVERRNSHLLVIVGGLRDRAQIRRSRTDN